jgi:hypothetical protein
VRSRQEAVEKLASLVRNAMEDRDLHKILKSGCKVEESKLGTAEWLVNLLAVLCVLSWRIFMDEHDQPRRPCSTGTGIHHNGASSA